MKPPKDARLIHRDGTETPLELVYAGRDEEGTHIFVATAAAYRPGDAIRVAELPPRTAIQVRARGPE